MPTTINAQNALQIREKPMEVYISLRVGSTATISTYTVTGQTKSNDSTLGNSSWPMRKLADLQDGGFLLDGTAQWYDSTLTPSENNGKLSVRGDIGETITVTITAGSTLTAVTVASSGVSTITKGADTYTATGNDVITINSTTATLVFTPIDSDTRVEIDYIVPGIIFNITNDTLISCTLALRGNLDVKDHTWEESEIEVKMYYPNDISSSLAYIQNDWPITYQAGYDSDLSTERKFYISEPITQEQGVITIKGVDASHLLDEKTMQETWFGWSKATAHTDIYYDIKYWVEKCGITLVNVRNWSVPPSSTAMDAVIPEMSVRDYVANVMNLTLNHKHGGTSYGIQFVDGGIPTLEYGDGTYFGNTWTIYKSDCGNWVEQYDQNIRSITNTNTDHKFNENVKDSEPVSKIITEPETITINQLYDYSFDSLYVGAGPTTVYLGGHALNVSIIRDTPSGICFKILSGSAAGKQFQVDGFPLTITSGVNSFSNPNGLPGVVLESEPMVYGNIVDSNNESVLNYPSLFKRSLRTGSFTWKGDPRMQPLDYINITNDTGDGRGNITARITGIELTHEEGGTSAKITWREWS